MKFDPVYIICTVFEFSLFKLIPEKYKNGDENGQKTMDDLVKVAAAGIRGNILR